jgi:type IV secretory pathway VirB2 component (pilin)
MINKKSLLLFILSVSFIMLSTFAFADDADVQRKLVEGNGVASFACKITSFLQSSLGVIIIIIALIVFGVSIQLGLETKGRVLMLIISIGLFGAFNSVIKWLISDYGEDADCYCKTEVVVNTVTGEKKPTGLKRDCTPL